MSSPSSRHRTALVTGAASGIGLEVARSFAQEGMSVLLVDRSDEVVEIAKSLPTPSGGVSVGIVADLGVEEAVSALAAAALRDHGGVDILVNNAGIHPKHDGNTMTLEQTSTKTWNDVLAVNLTAPFVLTRDLSGAMIERGWGRIVNVASAAGRTGSAVSSTSYSASKAGLLGLSRKLAVELAAHGITVNCVAPGPILTGMSQEWTEDKRATIAGRVPLGRFGTSTDVAAAVAYLASDAAEFLTGAVIDVNGGTFMP